jgi:hypothetical protein
MHSHALVVQVLPRAHVVHGGGDGGILTCPMLILTHLVLRRGGKQGGGPGTMHQAHAYKASGTAPGTRHQAAGVGQKAPGTSHQAPGTSHQAPVTQRASIRVRSSDRQTKVLDEICNCRGSWGEGGAGQVNTQQGRSRMHDNRKARKKRVCDNGTDQNHTNRHNNRQRAHGTRCTLACRCPQLRGGFLTRLRCLVMHV